jgi:hypothetical protein
LLAIAAQDVTKELADGCSSNGVHVTGVRRV